MGGGVAARGRKEREGEAIYDTAHQILQPTVEKHDIASSYCDWACITIYPASRKCLSYGPSHTIPTSRALIDMKNNRIATLRIECKRTRHMKALDIEAHRVKST